MADSFLRISAVNKKFGGVCALDSVSLEIEKGEIHCLIGENGSGKSTLIKIISGFYVPDAGEVQVDGKNRDRFDTISAINEGIQVIYQDLSIFPNLTVAENIALPVYKTLNRKILNRREIYQIAKRAFEKIGISLPLEERLEDLSVANKQIVAIARAIYYKAKLLILDEPMTSLTRKEIDKLFIIIRSLQSQGVSILFVSHKLDEVFEIADRFTVLRNGKNVITDVVKNVDHKKMVYYMTGRRIIDDRFLYASAGSLKPIFQVQNLSLMNGFEDISFEVLPGEILGITGLLGSGKNELALSLFGIYPAEKGKIRIKGRDVIINSPVDALKQKITYIPEDRLTEGLFLSHSIMNNLVVTSLDKKCDSFGLLDLARIYHAAIRWTDRLSVAMGSIYNSIDTLSGGNQQKVVIAKWLETEPDILILNGPTVGVDIGAKFDVYYLIRELVKDCSTGVIIISADLSEIVQNCNRILVMKNGRIATELVGKSVDEDKLTEILAG
ncbi:lipase [Anaerolineaceae bacterium oral taxon 439]|nr:lipase [Anaerolineaceae bacterium oral taxon 439]